MSYLVAVPEILSSAATDLAGIAGTLDAAHASAAASTTEILAAAKDEVSAADAALFSGHAQSYDLTLFAAGLQSGNLLEAIGQPIATDTYLIPLAGAFEAFAVIGQVESVIGDL